MEADGLKIARNRAVALPRRNGFFVQNLENRLGCSGAVKRRRSGQPLVEYNAQTVDVGGDGQILATGRSFGGHVGRRPLPLRPETAPHRAWSPIRRPAAS